jgi:hypothetical protein
MKATRTILVSFVLLAALACGPSITVYPLVNEDADVVKTYGYSPRLDPEAADVRALAAFYRACLEDDVELVWSLLAADTRALFDNLGKVHDGDGRALLRAKRWPSLSDNRVSVNASAVELFFFKGDVTFERDPAAAEQRFVVVDAANHAKPLRFVVEEGALKVQVDDLKRLLP